jgi:hypothetical protein
MVTQSPSPRRCTARPSAARPGFASIAPPGASSGGSEGDSDYSGTLNLHAEQDRTIVDIELHTERTATDEIDQSLDTTLDHIQHQVETGREPPRNDDHRAGVLVAGRLR